MVKLQDTFLFPGFINRQAKNSGQKRMKIKVKKRRNQSMTTRDRASSKRETAPKSRNTSAKKEALRLRLRPATASTKKQSLRGGSPSKALGEMSTPRKDFSQLLKTESG